MIRFDDSMIRFNGEFTRREKVPGPIRQQTRMVCFSLVPSGTNVVVHNHVESIFRYFETQTNLVCSRSGTRVGGLFFLKSVEWPGKTNRFRIIRFVNTKRDSSSHKT